MKKILLLGGALTQLCAIQKAKELGYYVIVCDGNHHVPGKDIADEFHHIDTQNIEQIQRLASSKQLDGVLCYGSDSGAVTAAVIAARLGLPGQPVQAVNILTNKELFRQFQRQHQFNTPKAMAFSSYEEAMRAIKKFHFPLILKPVDASGSKGVAKLESAGQLEVKVKEALQHSRKKRFIIEQYIEKKGQHIGGDGFSINGQLVFHAFSNEYFPNDDDINRFVPIVTTWPHNLSEQLEQKVAAEVQKHISALQLTTGAYNFDIRVDHNDDVYIIEMAPRNGGDCNPEAIQYATGVDLMMYSLKAAVGEDCSALQMVQPTEYVATYVVNSCRSGVFKGLTFNTQLQQHMLASQLVVKKNDKVRVLTGSHDKLGVLLLQFPTKHQMDAILKNIKNLVTVHLQKTSIKLGCAAITLQENWLTILKL